MNVSGAHVDPDDLRTFADVLQRSRAELDEILSDVRGQVIAVSESWRDAEYQKFVDVFRVTETTLGRLAEAIQHFVPILRSDADKLETYRGISLD
jgi:uncharacterized protein YukE